MAAEGIGLIATMLPSVPLCDLMTISVEGHDAFQRAAMIRQLEEKGNLLAMFSSDASVHARLQECIRSIRTGEAIDEGAILEATLDQKFGTHGAGPTVGGFAGMGIEER